MNDYNKTIGDPVIREGNWVEERSLREYTGNHRNYNVNDPTQTAKRNIFHSGCPKEWATQSGSVHNKYVHEPEKNGTVSVATALPRVSKTKVDQYLALAQQIVDDDEVQEAKRIEDEVNSSRFQGCNPLNRKRALEPVGRVPHLNGLQEAALTKYSVDPKNADRMTPQRSGNPFGKSTAFSKPDIEYTEDRNR